MLAGMPLNRMVVTSSELRALVLFDFGGHEQRLGLPSCSSPYLEFVFFNSISFLALTPPPPLLSFTLPLGTQGNLDIVTGLINFNANLEARNKVSVLSSMF